MARKHVKPRSFYEPWVAKRSANWDAAFRGGPIIPKGTPEDEQPAIIEAFELSKARAMQDAPWVVWGTGLHAPSICRSTLTGEPIVMDSLGIIGVSLKGYLDKGMPNQDVLAARIAECVNAMAHIAEPETFIKDLREFLLYCCRGDYDADPREDPRAVSLLGRCIPAEELQELIDAGSNLSD